MCLLSNFGGLIWTAKTTTNPIHHFLVLYVPIIFKSDMSIHALTCNWDILDIVDNLYACDPKTSQKVS